MENKIKVIIFCLNGYGYYLLSYLLQLNDIKLIKVYTRQEKSKFKYFEVNSIENICESNNIKYEYIEEKGKWNCESADLGIIFSFHRILKEKHISKFKKIINIHPSLLPKHKGATPTTWSLLNGEIILGLSAHIATNELDAGPLIFQEKLLNPYLHDGNIRKNLGFLSKKIIENIVNYYPDYNIVKNNYEESIEGKWSLKDYILDIDNINSEIQLINFIKAFTPIPMPRIKIRERVFIIDYEDPKDFIEIKIDNKEFNILGYWEND
ncbi:MAG: hypothetical protein M0P94_03350 [Candidatus Absconditabacterales bacterium]|nr:hypothetical protein [Candidatus Absconditabacterales bacterium]